MKMNDMMYDMSGVNEDSNLLGCDTVLDEWFLITSEIEGTTSLCNVGNHSPKNTMSQPWILQQFHT